MMIGTSVDHALEVLRRGGIVAIPTETVYGLAADARNPDAVRRIFTAKGRPADHPLIVHIADATQLLDWAAEVPPAAALLAVTPSTSTTTVELLGRFRGGLAAPSANLFGRVSPTTAEHVEHDLGDLVDYVLDGGRCPVGVESTIVDCTITPPQILRHGGIPAEQISALLDGRLASATGPSRAPGMLAAHYAPRARVLLVPTSAEALALAYGQDSTWVLDRTDDLVDYARSLYSDLRQADARGVTTIVAVLPPPVGIGHAIRDRLAKAAAAH